jgi:hypothetical protein
MLKLFAERRMVTEKSLDQLLDENQNAVINARKAVASFFTLEDIERSLVDACNRSTEHEGENESLAW